MVHLEDVIINDPLYYSWQWNLHDESEYGINAEGAWEYTWGDPNIIIGIMDYGVRSDHSDLFPRVYGDYDYTGSHGTAVAGIAAATTNNSNLIAGICGNSKIYSGRLYDGEGYEGVAYTIIDAVDFGAHVLNNSWGLIPPDQYVGVVRRAMAYAYKMNRNVVCSKGNDGSSALHYPSDFGQGIISVGAYDKNGVPWAYSNTGHGIDVSAPGVDIPTLTASGTDTWFSSFTGTSAAAPHVSGLAGLLKGYDNSLYNDDVENIVKTTAIDMVDEPASEGYDDYTGWGMINARAAFEILQKPNILTHAETSEGSEYASTENYLMAFFDIPDLASFYYTVKRYDVRKWVNFDHPYFQVPNAWGCGVATTGYSAENPNYGLNYCRVIPESITETGCYLQTFVYDVWTILGTHIGWLPCQPSEAQFAYTVLGEYELQASPYLSCTRHWDHQSIKVCFEDKNLYEEGWVIERKDATTQTWQVIETIPANPDAYYHYEDYYPVGSETYTYRVRPFTESQQNAPYSDEITITARPNRVENLSATVTDYSGPVPGVLGCDAEVSTMSFGLGNSMTMGSEPPQVPPDVPAPCHGFLGNDITVRWSPPINQKLPIVDYYVKRCVPPGTAGPVWHTSTDTCLFICPNPTQTGFNMYVYAIASNGDTSLSFSDGVCTGTVNSCPDNITKEYSEESIVSEINTSLYQNQPNPFNLATRIQFSLSDGAHVTLAIYDVLGRNVRTLTDSYFESGNHIVTWDGTDTRGEEVSSGIYFYRIEAENFVASRKMLMLK